VRIPFGGIMEKITISNDELNPAKPPSQENVTVGTVVTILVVLALFFGYNYLTKKADEEKHEPIINTHNRLIDIVNPVEPYRALDLGGQVPSSEIAQAFATSAKSAKSVSLDSLSPEHRGLWEQVIDNLSKASKAAGADDQAGYKQAAKTHFDLMLSLKNWARKNGYRVRDY